MQQRPSSLQHLLTRPFLHSPRVPRLATIKGRMKLPSQRLLGRFALASCILSRSSVVFAWSCGSSSGANLAASRAQFLSASAATFLTSAAWATNADECQAKDSASVTSNKNPRYIDQELEMKYGEDSKGNPRTRGMLVRRLTGDSTPYSFPVTPVRLVQEWPKDPPFKPEDFFRSDPSDDSGFYTLPR